MGLVGVCERRKGLHEQYTVWSTPAKQNNPTPQTTTTTIKTVGNGRTEEGVVEEEVGEPGELRARGADGPRGHADEAAVCGFIEFGGLLLGVVGVGMMGMSIHVTPQCPTSRPRPSLSNKTIT